MIEKVPIHPHRVRKAPKQFSRLVHRLVHDRYIERCPHQAAAPYVFLVTVAEGEGLSFHSVSSVMKRLSMGETDLREARRSLVGLQLIAHVKPRYQVLPLDPEVQVNTPRTKPSMHRPIPIGEVFKKIADCCLSCTLPRKRGRLLACAEGNWDFSQKSSWKRSHFRQYECTRRGTVSCLRRAMNLACTVGGMGRM
jgi:hypothetical protein